MGGYSDSFRDDVYRVDREKARLYFFRGEEMPPPKRSKYQPSHKVFIREPIISFQLYDTILCQRNLVNGTLWFNHGGWITKETMKDLHPLFAEYFGGNLHLVRKNNCLYLLDPRYGYSRIEKTAMEVKERLGVPLDTDIQVNKNDFFAITSADIAAKHNLPFEELK